MKNRKSFFVILAILLMGLLGWWLWKKNTPAPAMPSIKYSLASSSTAKTTGAASITATRSGAISPTPGSLTTGQIQVKINPALPDSEKLQMLLNAKNNGVINVFGKVVDQFGVPIPSVVVKGATLLISAAASGGKQLDTTTDTSGLFNFTGLHGARFGLHLEKAGYEYNSKLYTTWWDSYKPDPANPMVFTMYKLQGAEPMVHIKFGRTIPCDGTEVRYNLLTGKEVASGGDLIVSFIRNPVDIKRGTPFEWTLTLQAPGGGLVEIHDPYSYEAPESGYQETVTIGTGPDPKNYTDSITKNYYYKSADGKYGRLFIDLQADFQPPPTSFDGSIYLNPSGSRNLEFDPAKQIKP